jgi:glycosyltransferase involved in cell wall biosynthesis
MSQSGKKILFFGHEASRTGAPLALFLLMRWLQKNSAHRCELFLKNGGELEADYAAIVPTTNLEAATQRDLPERFRAALTPRPQRWRDKIRRRVARQQPDLIFANTAAVANEVAACAGLGIPVIWNIHEGPFVQAEFNSWGQVDRAIGAADMFIAASAMVRDALLARGVAAEKIRVVYEFLQPSALVDPDKKASRAALRRLAGWPEEMFVVGMCGSASWVKGLDHFVATAHKLALEFPEQPIAFAWLGKFICDADERKIRYDLRKTGLESRVHFFTPRPDTAEFMAGLDVFFLSSREDVFPLAMLEAGAQGQPVVCFADSGGGPEFASDDAGVVVPHSDTTAAARALAGLQADPERRQRLGAAARHKSRMVYTIDIQAGKLAAVIDEQLKICA